MEDDKAARQIAKLSARSLAMRDIIIRLLANEAKRASDPEAFFQKFMEGADGAEGKASAESEGSPGGGEAVRVEVKKIVSFARKIL